MMSVNHGAAGWAVAVAGMALVALGAGCESTYIPPPRDAGADRASMDSGTADAGEDAAMDAAASPEAAAVDTLPVEAGVDDARADAPMDVASEVATDAPTDVPPTAIGDCRSGTMFDEDGDGVRSIAGGGRDCDDHDCDRYPGNAEVCDATGHDEDCDPCTVSSTTTRDGDRDIDNFVSDRCSNAFTGAPPACDPMRARVDATMLRVTGLDCDDNPATGANVHPNQQELCNGVDDNCVGGVDESGSSRVYADEDGDHRGNPATGVLIPSCVPPPMFVTNSEDCNDHDITVFRGAPELCDGLDNDCSLSAGMAGGRDAAEDADEDTHSPIGATCIARGEPGATAAAYPKDDCDDTRPLVYLNAPEICDRRDSDCSEPSPGGERVEEDRDGDGHSAPTAMCLGRGEAGAPLAAFPKDDCDDAQVNAFPRASTADTCDGVDNDCDGAVDNGPGLSCTMAEEGRDLPCADATCGGASGTQRCTMCRRAECTRAGGRQCAAGSPPVTCTPTGGLTACGHRTCGADCTLSTCVAPTEVCNGVDDNCDGRADEGLGTACGRYSLVGGTAGGTVMQSAFRLYGGAGWYSSFTVSNPSTGDPAPETVYDFVRLTGRGIYNDVGAAFLPQSFLWSESMFVYSEILLQPPCYGLDSTVFGVCVSSRGCNCPERSGRGFAIVLASRTGVAATADTSYGVPTGEGYAFIFDVFDSQLKIARLSATGSPEVIQSVATSFAACGTRCNSLTTCGSGGQTAYVNAVWLRITGNVVHFTVGFNSESASCSTSMTIPGLAAQLNQPRYLGVTASTGGSSMRTNLSRLDLTRSGSAASAGVCDRTYCR